MILPSKCIMGWKRVNSRLIENLEGTEWRTSTGSKLVTQQFNIYDKNNNKIKIQEVRLPLCIAKQGRLAKDYRISKVNQYVYKPIINEKEKKVYYKIMRCSEKGCKGKIRYNKYEEKQCDKCGIIHEDVYFKINDTNDAIIKSSWNNTDLNFVSDISREAKEHNDRIKRIIEWEKGRKQ